MASIEHILYCANDHSANKHPHIAPRAAGHTPYTITKHAHAPEKIEASLPHELRITLRRGLRITSSILAILRLTSAIWLADTR